MNKRELQTISDILKGNGYPEHFITKKLTKRETAERKSTYIYIYIPFKGDLAADKLNRRLYQSLEYTYPTAELRSWLTSTPMLNLNLKDKIPVHDYSMLVYLLFIKTGDHNKLRFIR